MVATTLMTIEEFEQLPGERWELIRGEPYEMPPPGGRHGKFSVRFSTPLDLFITEHRLGELYVDAGFVITKNPDTVVGPDLAFVQADRLLPEEEQISLLHQVPDLVIEIVSPSDSATKVLDKVMQYLAAGVPLVWGVDPRRQRVVVWRGNGTFEELGPEDTLDGEDVLPGFQLELANVFR